MLLSIELTSRQGGPHGDRKLQVQVTVDTTVILFQMPNERNLRPI